MRQAVLRLLRERDRHCWHCGQVDDLVPHHRANRQMGGSKARAERLENLLMVCAVYNGLMESDAVVARQARKWGHKLRSWDGFDVAVWDVWSGLWYRLDPLGGKHVTLPPGKLS